MPIAHQEATELFLAGAKDSCGLDSTHTLPVFTTTFLIASTHPLRDIQIFINLLVNVLCIHNYIHVHVYAHVSISKRGQSSMYRIWNLQKTCTMYNHVHALAYHSLVANAGLYMPGPQYPYMKHVLYIHVYIYTCTYIMAFRD